MGIKIVNGMNRIFAIISVGGKYEEEKYILKHYEKDHRYLETLYKIIYGKPISNVCGISDNEDI